ncbi:farnesol kinase, chloroplastic isoform X1 [Ricinus communis]|uniref:Phytol kinase 1, chloroplast, putative n=1 Tax=Ricinus communis TaxID=3988 RepID=B9RSC8_RICCO|nr:farnesol kinase, chloroplastic isoform X1 [Ricinus communis]EEF45742.1 Phytol kinase 1, chloroplast precursor, putative [Ricinus communis]|eukprot:XP_002516647.1 farnesol kinase, chloroplastic [Ricinus communis]
MATTAKLLRSSCSYYHWFYNYSPLPLPLHSPQTNLVLPYTSTRLDKAQRSNHSRYLRSAVRATMLHQNPIVSDLCATGLSGAIALSVLRLWKETAIRGIFDQKLNRKLVHISIGLVFMLCWPLFSSGHQGAILAALTPGVNIFRMLLLGLGIWKDEATVKSMSRFGDHRELLKGPLYYALTITLACAIYWRTSPIAIAAICNLCAGDGIADIVGRRFGRQKIPYNRDKSIAGSIAMALAGFIASVMFMYYFASFGYLRKSYEMILGFLVVSLASTLVESLPISTELDDNLTVTVTSILLGTLVF